MADAGQDVSLAGRVNRFRFYSYTAIVTMVLTVVTFGIAILTPPLSGPSCRENCFEYPYADIAARFPRDYWWMYFAIVLTLVYVVLMACIHDWAAPDRKLFTQVGLSFAVIAAAALVSDYFVQVTVIPPSLDRGELDGIALLTQFNAHGVFIALEELGYLVMSLSLFFAAFAFTGQNRAERALRWLWIGGFVIALVALVGVTVIYGTDREYRFEIAIIALDWLALIVGGGLLSRVFARGG